MTTDSSDVMLIADGLDVPVRLSRKAALMSKMVEGALKTSPLPVVKLDSVLAPALLLVAEYLARHDGKEPQDIEAPIRSTDMAQVASDPLDVRFVEALDQPQLLELIQVAQYMDISPLLDLLCAKVATMLKGKTAAEIRTILCIRNDFTPEEEAAARAELMCHGRRT